jgi:malonate-semialdehyde dehydrogenase (acetylating) / methylmalonate-semialdehyde dehydrogenase
LLVAVGDCEPVLERIAEAASKVRLGHDMGAIIDRPALERLRTDIDGAKKDGARVRLDGRDVVAPAGYERGNWLAPTIVDDARYGMGCTTKELFGPIMTVVRARNLDEALEIERRGEYGNAISVFTTKGAVARYVAENATSGMIGINVGVPVPREPFSFGGTKHSRFGEGDITGKAGIEHWSFQKKITSKWELSRDNSWMS